MIRSASGWSLADDMPSSAVWGLMGQVWSKPLSSRATRTHGSMQSSTQQAGKQDAVAGGLAGDVQQELPPCMALVCLVPY